MSDDKVKDPYAIRIRSRGEFLHVLVSGKRVTPGIALDYWREIISECEKTGSSKILLEHDFVEMISMQEMLEVIGPVGNMLKGRMLAFYDRYGHYDIPKAGKTILRGHESADLLGPEPGRTLAAGPLIAGIPGPSNFHPNLVN